VSRFRGAIRATRRRVRLHGTSIDRGCIAGRAGRPSTRSLRLVRVAIGQRLSARRCRFLRGDGTLGPPVDCRRTTYLSATGSARFSLDLRARLPRGRYVGWVRGLDVFGNIERKARRRNLARFVIR
jgi:hypothetical protein